MWADFNGDGVLDFVSTFGYNAWASVRHGEAFEERTSTFPYPIDHYATPIEAIDVDGDGFLDTVDKQGHVAFGNGYGDFTGSLNRGPGTIGAFIDLDGDGRREYIGATDSSLDLYRFNADRTFTQIKSLPAIMYPLRIVAGDFDGNGRTA